MNKDTDVTHKEEETLVLLDDMKISVRKMKETLMLQKRRDIGVT